MIDLRERDFLLCSCSCLLSWCFFECLSLFWRLFSLEDDELLEDDEEESSLEFKDAFDPDSDELDDELEEDDDDDEEEEEDDDDDEEDESDLLFIGRAWFLESDGML